MSPDIEDRFAIQDLLFRYARAADQRDVAAFASCFRPGQVHITGPGFEVRDAQQNVDALTAMFEWTMHKVHNHEYQVQGDRAEGYCYCLATHVQRKGDMRIKIDWHIRYDDELTREDGAWRFVRRHLDVGLIETVPLAP
ncbi:nuclear transport factor 2 family protein [Denitratisoma oestradiolicum]|uniref:SnoaL-like domain-containing protein n=1 Tax=Denitratisoma oestradiolicum TaxID=311182 RepID=A0A6S6XXY4_9PROT|nr:nuclear transport factor 2 family protein [Denitratisoma oestradiolicum]CAB1370889.1 conserved protein of unknown function [Denitratisoma oestradiolicum]